MSPRSSALAVLVLLLTAASTMAQGSTSEVDQSVLRQQPVCEMVLVELMEGAFTWGLMDACWTGERLYLPLDSLGVKLGIAMMPSLAQLDAAASHFIRLDSTLTGNPALYFLEPSSDHRYYADGGILAHVLTVQFEFSYLEMQLRVLSSRPSPRRARVERLSSVGKRVRPDDMYPDAYPMPRERRLVHPGVVLWNLSSTQWYDSRAKRGYYGYLGNMNYRTELLGGALSVNQTLRDGRSIFEERPDLSLMWDFSQPRWVRSARIGIQQASLSEVRAADGWSITNRPPHPRSNAGNWSFDGLLPAGWDMEVLQGNMLVGSGMASHGATPFTFSLPLNYGQNTYTARWYNQNGLQRERSFRFFVPSRALPKGEFEYNVTSGWLRTQRREFFGSAQLAYGLLRQWTLTTDVYALDSKHAPTYHRIRPGFTYADRWGNAVEASYGTKGGYDVRYQFLNLRSGNVGFTYTRIKPEELEPVSIQAIVRRNATGYAEQRFQHGSTFASISARADWTDFGRSENLNIAARSQLSMARVQSSVSYSRTYVRGDRSKFRSAFDQLTLGTSRSMSRFWSVSGSLATQPSAARFHSASLAVQRGVRKAFVSTEVRYDHPSRAVAMLASLRVQFNQVGVITQWQSQKYTAANTATLYGSVAYDPSYRQLFFDHVNTPDRSGVAVSAFLDQNGNGKHDKGEEFVEDLDIRMARGGRKMERTKNARVTQIADLLPYEEYHLIIGGASAYPDYKALHPVVRFVAEPNRWKTIMVPLQPSVEVVLIVSSANALAPNTSSLKLTLEPIDGSQKPFTAVGFNDGTLYLPQVTPGRYRMVWDEQQFRIRGLGHPLQDILEIRIDDAPAVEKTIVLPVRS